jgi:hypothetical protein
LGFESRAGPDQNVHARDPRQAPDLASEDEGVPRVQHLEIAFLDLPDLAPAHQARPLGDAGREHFRRRDGAQVQPVTPGGLTIAHGPEALGVAHQPAKTVVGRSAGEPVSRSHRRG